MGLYWGWGNGGGAVGVGLYWGGAILGVGQWGWGHTRGGTILRKWSHKAVLLTGKAPNTSTNSFCPRRSLSKAGHRSPYRGGKEALTTQDHTPTHTGCKWQWTHFQIHRDTPGWAGQRVWSVVYNWSTCALPLLTSPSARSRQAVERRRESSAAGEPRDRAAHVRCSRLSTNSCSGQHTYPTTCLSATSHCAHLCVPSPADPLSKGSPREVLSGRQGK